MAAGFIFGGNTGETAQSLARKRAYAEALLAPGETPRNATEGWGAIAKALAGRFALSGVEKEEGERRQRASDAVARALGGLGPFPEAPNAGAAGTGGSAVMAALNGETAKPKPVNPNLPSRMDFANAANAQQPGEIEIYIRQAAIQRGIDPDIAVRVAQSEGGLIDPVRQSDVIKDGVREPSFGPFQLYMNGGLGNAFQTETGLHPSDPNAWRQGVDFALDSAKKDGWGAWYGAKNVGITGMDGIGDPAAALDRLAAGTPQGPGRQGEIRQGRDGRSYQYAETTGMANATESQGWIPVNAQAPVQVAQAGGDFSQFSPAAGGTGGTVQPGQLDLGLLFEAARNPDLSAEERGLINMLLEQEMQKRDPVRQLEIQKLQRELSMPVKRDTTTVNGKLVDGQTGAVIADIPDQKKPTTSQQDYEYYADFERRNNRTPLGPLEWEQAQRKAGATTVNVGGEPGDGDLRKELDKKTGEQWSTYQTVGANSAAMTQDMQIIDELIKIAPQGPVTGRLAEMFPGYSSAGDAFQSIVKRIAPTLRAPGSGATSDIEYEGMLRSLPALRNKPEANTMISEVIKAKAALNVERARIIDAYQSGQISAGDARNQMAEIDKRSIMTPEMRKALVGIGAEPVEMDGYVIQEVE